MPKPRNIGDMFIETLNAAISREEVVALFERLTKALKEYKDELTENAAINKGELAEAASELRAEVSRIASDLTRSVDENKEITRSEARTLKRYIDQEVNRVIDLIPELPDLSPLQDDYISRIEQVSKRIPVLPEQRDYSTEITATKEELLEEIKRLREEIAAIPRGTVGGVSNLRIQQAFKYILKTEAPTGDIDGANLTYTLSQPIFAILNMSINGETIAQLPNYTIKGNTFVFSSALPAAYSGKDFEVKYL